VFVCLNSFFCVGAIAVSLPLLLAYPFALCRLTSFASYWFSSFIDKRLRTNVRVCVSEKEIPSQKILMFVVSPYSNRFIDQNVVRIDHRATNTHTQTTPILDNATVQRQSEQKSRWSGHRRLPATTTATRTEATPRQQPQLVARSDRQSAKEVSIIIIRHYGRDG